MIDDRNTGLDNPNLFNELSDNNKQKLLKQIDENLYSIKSFNDRHTSYGLKHKVPFYVYNGVFKGAMLAAGYKVKNKSDRNWVFNISQKSKCLRRNL